jgi:hypothetical protein
MKKDIEKMTYVLISIINKTKPYHALDMKPFLFNPLHTDPLDIARMDYSDFFVEKVLDMTGDPKKVTTLQFLIKWLRYDDTHNK